MTTATYKKFESCFIEILKEANKITEPIQDVDDLKKYEPEIDSLIKKRLRRVMVEQLMEGKKALSKMIREYLKIVNRHRFFASFIDLAIVSNNGFNKHQFYIYMMNMRHFRPPFDEKDEICVSNTSIDFEACKAELKRVLQINNL